MKFLKRLFIFSALLAGFVFSLYAKYGPSGSNLIPIHTLLNVSTPVNEHDFKLVVNPGVSKCAQKDMLLVTVVFIAPQFFDRRKLIRETWASSANHSNFLVLFAMGLSPDPIINKSIYQESVTFNDIIQESFLDSYKNLTLKTIMTLKWVSTYCPNTRFILRVNDDVVVNVPYLLKHLDSIRSVEKKIIGNYFPSSGIDRRPGAKFYISYEQYNQSRYYPYCEGSAYIITQDLAKPFYELSKYVRWEPFSTWLEDVYLGILAAYLNVSFIQFSQHFSSSDQYSYKSFSQLKKMNREYLYFVYVKDPLKDIKPVWHILNQK